MAGQHQTELEDDASRKKRITSRGNSYLDLDLDFMFGMDRYKDEYEFEFEAPPVGPNSHLNDEELSLSFPRCLLAIVVVMMITRVSMTLMMTRTTTHL